MANPKKDPVAWLMQVELNPQQPVYSGCSRTEAATVIEEELSRLRARLAKLQMALRNLPEPS